jgi:hypothetical protein
MDAGALRIARKHKVRAALDHVLASGLITF